MDGLNHLHLSCIKKKSVNLQPAASLRYWSTFYLWRLRNEAGLYQTRIRLLTQNPGMERRGYAADLHPSGVMYLATVRLTAQALLQTLRSMYVYNCRTFTRVLRRQLLSPYPLLGILRARDIVIGYVHPHGGPNEID